MAPTSKERAVLEAGMIEVEVLYNLPAFAEPTMVRAYVKVQEVDALLAAAAKGTSFQGESLAFPAMSAIFAVRIVTPYGRTLAAQAV